MEENGATVLEIKQQLDRVEQLIELQVILQKPILSLEEVALYTGYEQKYIYKLTCKKKIPHYKPNGKNLTFKREEIDEWMLRNRIATDEEIENEAINRVVNGN